MDDNSPNPQLHRVTYQDDGTHYWTFYRAQVLVECPRCRAQAVIAPETERAVERRAVCRSCGWAYVSSRVTGRAGTSFILDAHNLALWLQTHCLGHTLWALNHEHLALLKRILAADLRRSAIYVPRSDALNASIASRLPKWMLKPSHRDAVLKAIDALAAK